MGINPKQTELEKELAHSYATAFDAAENCKTPKLQRYLESVKDRIQTSLVYEQVDDTKLAEGCLEVPESERRTQSKF
jgi:hypothetical protein